MEPKPTRDWLLYDGLIFDQSSPDPNELVIIARLDVLRHQRFSEPLPFDTDGASIFEHVAEHVDTLFLELACTTYGPYPGPGPYHAYGGLGQHLVYAQLQCLGRPQLV